MSFWYSFQINKTAFQTEIVPLLESAQLEGAGVFLSITEGNSEVPSPPALEVYEPEAVVLLEGIGVLKFTSI